MKIAILGGGSIGTRHAKNLLALGIALEDVTVYDVTTAPRCASEIPGIRVSPAAVPVSRWATFDAGVICTPADCHAFQAAMAILHATPFLLEKPAALSVESLDDLLAASDRVPHLVACNMRFLAPVNDLRQAWIGAHERGDSASVQFKSYGDMARWPGGDYAHAAHEFCHEIDLVCWLYRAICQQPPTRVGSKVHSAYLPGGGVTVEMRSSGLVSREGERDRVTTSFQVNIRPNWPTFMRVGRLDTRSSRATVTSVTEYYRWQKTPSCWDDSYFDEMRHFLAVARGEAASVNTLRQARDVVRMCEQMERAGQ